MELKMDFVKGNTAKCFWFMFLPVMTAMFLNMAYTLVDSLWIGNLLGEKAYAALTSSTPIILFLNSIAMGAANGAAILVSQAVGKKDEIKKDRIIATSLAGAIAFAIGVTALMELLLPALLKILNTPGETLKMAQEYLTIYLLGYISVYLYCYFTAVLRSSGNAVFQMAAMLICTVLNGILDPLFINWSGFKGAAAATVLSQTICLIFMMIYIGRKKLFAFRINDFQASLMKDITAKVIPSAFQQSIPAVSTGFLTSLVSSFGISAIAAYGITGKLEIILFYPAMAMNMILTNIIGQCKGAGRPDREKDYLKYSIKAGILLLTVLSAGVVWFAKPLAGLFLNSERAAQIAAGYFRIASIGYVLNTVTNSFLGTLNGIGKPLKSMLLMVLYYMIARMPLAWAWKEAGFGLNGIWSAVLVSHIVASAASASAGLKEINRQS